MSRLTRAAILSVGLLCPVAVFAEDPIFIKPGDSSSIEFPIEFDPGGIGAALGVRIDIDAPGFFRIKPSSIRGPVDVPPGETRTFVIDYEIAAPSGETAPEGPFEVTLRPRAESTNTARDLEVYDAIVRFSINHSSREFSLHGIPLEF